MKLLFEISMIQNFKEAFIKLISHNLWITEKVNEQSLITVANFVAQDRPISWNNENICTYELEATFVVWALSEITS